MTKNLALLPFTESEGGALLILLFVPASPKPEKTVQTTGRYRPGSVREASRFARFSLSSRSFTPNKWACRFSKT
jgi:hypothetical protein